MTKSEGRPSSLARVAAVLLTALLSLAGLAGPAMASDTVGALRGTLLNSDETVIASAQVAVYRLNASTPIASTVTDAAGNWSVSVPLGTYQVAFTWGGQTQWAFSRPTREQSDSFGVLPGSEVLVTNHWVSVAHVAGTVRSTTGATLSGICVKALSAVHREEVIAQGCTDASGHYDLPVGQPVAVVVQAADPTGRYATQYAPGVNGYSGGTRYQLTGGLTTTVNVRLAQSSAITGIAVSAAGRPVSGVCADVWIGRNGENVVGQVPSCSGTDGRWRVSTLPAGTFTVRLYPKDGASFAATWLGGPQRGLAQVVRVTRRGSTLDFGRVPVPVSDSGKIDPTYRYRSWMPIVGPRAGAGGHSAALSSLNVAPPRPRSSALPGTPPAPALRYP